MLPVLIILAVAVIEFGLLLGNMKQVAAAARHGAVIAAEDADVDTNISQSASDARDAVDRLLETANFGADASSGLTLRRNFSGDASNTQGTCDDPTTPSMPSFDAVRVSVCVPVTKLAPDLLSSFGFSISSRVVTMTATFPYAP